MAAATVALSVGLAAPASADAIDDYLDKVPGGQISCEQAASYYTNPGDYNNKKSQALAVANFHRRGGEIRSAVTRADEAIARCNLSQGGNHGITAREQGDQVTAIGLGRNTPAPGPAVVSPAASATPNQVIPILVVPGQATVDVPVANVVFRIPDVQKIVQNTVAQLPLAQGSSF
ncbi:MAG: hypothetical protein SOW59_09050 [Corynebacterium sp.]|nr:hypothetical protein [Corynebacterium sp.]